jgi:hypothetical protein
MVPEHHAKGRITGQGRCRCACIVDLPFASPFAKKYLAKAQKIKTSERFLPPLARRTPFPFETAETLKSDGGWTLTIEFPFSVPLAVVNHNHISVICHLE